MAKHRASAAPAGIARTGRRLGAAAGAVGGAVFLALLATGGTYALMNDGKQVTGATITAGSATVTINNVTSYAIAGLDTTKLLPGRSVVTATPLTVKNTGTVPLSITPGTVTFADPLSPLASQLVVAVRQAASCTLTAGTPVSFTSFTLAPQQTTTICVEVQLKSTAPTAVQGVSLGFTAPLSAVQVRP